MTRQKPVDMDGLYQTAQWSSLPEDTRWRPPGGPKWALATVFWLSLIALLVMVYRDALGHGDAYWIAAGGYKDAWGTSCCGNFDCHDLSSHGDVATYQPETDAYVITWRGRRQEVPSASVYVSERPGWWVCEWTADFDAVPGGHPAVQRGDVRCLFKPSWGF